MISPAPVLVLVVVGCSKSPPAERPRDVTVAPVDASAGQPLPPVPASASSAAPGSCAVDADCVLASSYCKDAPCVCMALPKGAPKPTCTSGSVTCFVDPCMKKGARCRAGACVVGAD